MLKSPLTGPGIEIPETLDMPDHIEAEHHEQAYIDACELVGPDSPEFDNLLDTLTDALAEKWYKEHDVKVP